MPQSEDRLPWYLDFTKLFIAAGVIGALLLGWFAMGQPGVSPKDGDYACLLASSYERREQSERQGGAFVYDPLEDQFGVTLKNGSIAEARVYPGDGSLTGPPEVRATSSYSFGTKKSSTTFTATIDGVQVGCYYLD